MSIELLDIQKYIQNFDILNDNKELFGEVHTDFSLIYKILNLIPNKEFNFSSNPSFATASDGTMTQSTFFKNPKTFITQVGLYNDDGELLAVAKLSKPLLKSYSREAIVKIKLDF